MAGVQWHIIPSGVALRFPPQSKLWDVDQYSCCIHFNSSTPSGLQCARRCGVFGKNNGQVFLKDSRARHKFDLRADKLEWIGIRMNAAEIYCLPSERARR
jgi:hypothetical protein